VAKEASPEGLVRTVAKEASPKGLVGTDSEKGGREVQKKKGVEESESEEWEWEGCIEEEEDGQGGREGEETDRGVPARFRHAHGTKGVWGPVRKEAWEESLGDVRREETLGALGVVLRDIFARHAGYRVELAGRPGGGVAVGGSERRGGEGEEGEKAKVVRALMEENEGKMMELEGKLRENRAAREEMQRLVEEMEEVLRVSVGRREGGRVGGREGGREIE
jgi:hypothetical protein